MIKRGLQAVRTRGKGSRGTRCLPGRPPTTAYFDCVVVHMMCGVVQMASLPKLYICSTILFVIILLICHIVPTLQ